MSALPKPLSERPDRCSAPAPGMPVPIGELVAAVLERVQMGDGPTRIDLRTSLHRRTATA